MRLAEIRLQEGESLENALRRFKRKVQQEDIIKEGRRHSFYLKPGEKKRVKQALARKRARKISQRVGLNCNLGLLPSGGGSQCV
jgi:small subunit ribosomal protein S21